MIVASRLSAVWAWAMVACYAVANLRLGAQLAFVPAARLAVAASVAIAVAAIVRSWRQPMAAGAVAL